MAFLETLVQDSESDQHEHKLEQEALEYLRSWVGLYKHPQTPS